MKTIQNQHVKNKPGRPSYVKLGGENECRERLIEAAKFCFIQQPFNKVTTRKLAQKAGVNAGLIRYYFINKEGLYKAMIGEMLSGIAKDISKLAQQQQIESIEPVLRSHAKIMQQYPEFPMLMFKELMGEGLCFNFIVEASNRIINPMFDQAISQLVEKGKLRPTIDHTLLRVTVLSVMFHPWLLRKAAPGVDGFELNESMVEKLIKHHTQIIEYGCFVQPDVDCD